MIYTHPAVKTVCVVGIEDDNAGEVPLACVIVKDGHTATEGEIVKLVEGFCFPKSVHNNAIRSF